MSFDKEYPNRKDIRRPYWRRAQRVDASCRPGGDCPYCSNGRQHRHKKRKFEEEDQD